MTLNLMGKNPYTGILSKFSLEFQSFVKDLGDAKSKGEEDCIVAREVAYLKEAIRKPCLTSKQQKEHIVRLIYCDMLGADVSFSHMEAVKFAQQPNLLEKRVAYSAISVLIDENNGSDCLMMCTGTIQRDLGSANVMEVCFGLLAASKVVRKDTLPAVLPMVKELLKHKREVVRKKAVMALLKFYDIEDDCKKEYIEIFQTILCDKDPTVMGVSLNGFYKFILEDPAPFKILVASFVSILKQIIEGKLPSEFKFKGVHSPWMQIKLLQILALLGSEDVAMSKMMYEVLSQCLQSVDTEQAIGCAVAYECMKTIASIYTNRALVEIAAAKAALFLTSDNYNLKYLGINALSDFINVDMSFGTRHQMVIIECLTDDDESIKRKTLDLLYRMTNGNNVKFICERLITYLRSTLDEYVKSDLVLRITTLAEKFAPDNEWFIETMNEVFELGGALVPVKVAYNMMAIIGEGIDEDEESDDATLDLRRHAVMAYIGLLDKPVIPDILIQLACWVVGEYFDLIEDYTADDVVALLYKVLLRKFHDPLTQSWVVSAIMKIISRTTNPERLIQDIDVSLLSTADARQRYHEMRSVVKICLDLEAVLPYDASCEDIDVDVNLSFLDGFVGQALQNGALSFSPDLIHHKKSEETTEVKEAPSLKFGPYDEPYRRFHKDKARSPPTHKSRAAGANEMEERLPKPAMENPVKGRSKLNKWTKEGYVGKQQHKQKEEGCSGSDASTLASSESSSIKTEENLFSSPPPPPLAVKVEESATPPREVSPTKSYKEEIAKQLFSTSPSTGDAQRKRRGGGSAPRRSKSDKPDFGRKNYPSFPSQQPTINLLDLDDIGGEMTSTPVDSHSLAGLALSNEPVPMRDVAGSDAPTFFEPSVPAPPVTSSIDMMSGLMMAADSHPGLTTSQGSSLESVLNQTSSLNLLDDDDYPSPQLTATSSTISDIVTTTPVTLYDEPETLPRDSPTIIALPDVLRQFEHSLNPIEICSSHHVRLTCQYVYQSAELTLVFFIINQSPHTITELQLVPKLPSNLKPVTSSTVNFHSKSLDSMTSCLHALSIGCNSPALNMVLSGNLIYRDAANTEKKIFINHVIPLRTLIRPFDLTVEQFGGKWQNRSLHSKKNKVDRRTSVELYCGILEEEHFKPVEIIGNEVISTGRVLNKSDILLHTNILQTSVEITVKSESTLLNDCVMKMLTNANW